MHGEKAWLQAQIQHERGQQLSTYMLRENVSFKITTFSLALIALLSLTVEKLEHLQLKIKISL